MHHLWFIGYHIVAILSTFNLDFNTSGNIWPMVFLFVDASIHYTLIINLFPNDLWCGIWFTLTIVRVVHCSSIYQYRTHALWVTGSNAWPKMVSAAVFFFFYFYFCAFKIKYINIGQPTTYGMYTPMTPQTHKFFIVDVNLIYNV